MTSKEVVNAITKMRKYFPKQWDEEKNMSVIDFINQYKWSDFNVYVLQ